VDPLKVEVILNLPPPSTLRQLQILQGKENFLRRFILNYAKIICGFTQLLKKDSEFVWDTIANNAFEALKLSLTRAPLLFPLITVTIISFILLPWIIPLVWFSFKRMMLTTNMLFTT
jgi:hypothetical protein